MKPGDLIRCTAAHWGYDDKQQDDSCEPTALFNPGELVIVLAYVNSREMLVMSPANKIGWTWKNFFEETGKDA